MKKLCDRSDENLSFMSDVSGFSKYARNEKHDFSVWQPIHNRWSCSRCKYMPPIDEINWETDHDHEYKQRNWFMRLLGR